MALLTPHVGFAQAETTSIMKALMAAVPYAGASGVLVTKSVSVNFRNTSNEPLTHIGVWKCILTRLNEYIWAL
jgi:hypothetical protein